MTVVELIKKLEKCNPESEVTVWFKEPIVSIMEIGGDSYYSKDVRICTQKLIDELNRS